MQHWLYAARNLKLLAIFSSGKSIHGWWHHRVLHVTKLLFVASYNISPSNPHDPSQFYLHSPDMMGSNYSYIPKTSTLYIPIFPYVPYFNLHQLSEKQKVNNITTTSGDSATAWKVSIGRQAHGPTSTEKMTFSLALRSCADEDDRIPWNFPSWLNYP